MSLTSGSEKQSLRPRCALKSLRGSAADRIGHFVEDAFVPVASALVRAEANGVRHRDRARRLRDREALAVDRLDDLSAVADASHEVPLPVDHVRSRLQLLAAERAAEGTRCLPILLDFELDLATTETAQARALAAEVADKLLANPVIESYRIEVDA